jgi:hypothetical protein
LTGKAKEMTMSNMQKKTFRMAVRVSKKEMEFLKQVAGEEGRPVGNLVRNWLLLHYLEELRLTPDEIKTLKEKTEMEALAITAKRKKSEKKIA